MAMCRELRRNVGHEPKQATARRMFAAGNAKKCNNACPECCVVMRHRVLEEITGVCYEEPYNAGGSNRAKVEGCRSASRAVVLYQKKQYAQRYGVNNRNAAVSRERL